MEAMLTLARRILEYCREFKAAGIIKLITDFIEGISGDVQPR